MKLNPRRFPARLADLEFAIEVPDGFVEPTLPPEDADFSDATKFAPLAIASSSVALALITVAGRPAYERGSVEQWIRYLCEHSQVTITGLISGFVGAPEPAGHLHPCVLVEGTMTQEGTALDLRIIALEDGQRLITAQAMCAAQLWSSYGSTLERSLLSFQLARPQGPTVPCVPGGPIPIVDMPGQQAGDWPAGRGAVVFDHAEQQARLEAAVAQARELILAGRYVEADASVTNASSDIRGAVALATLYRERLVELVASRDPSNQHGERDEQEVFNRAMAYAMNAYPEPHTEVEAERYERGQAEDRAALLAIVSGAAGASADSVRGQRKQRP